MRTLQFAAALLVSILLVGGCASKSDRARVRGDRDALAARALIERGNSAFLDGDLEAAAEAYEAALSADAFSGVAHNNLGKVYFQERRFYAAAKHFDRAARLLPHHSEPRNNLGLVLEEAGRLDEAVMAYERALKRQPDHPEVIGNLARARVRRGDTGNEVLRLLADLAFLDERPLWRKWARLTAIKLQPDERADDGWIAPASLDATPTTE